MTKKTYVCTTIVTAKKLKVSQNFTEHPLVKETPILPPNWTLCWAGQKTNKSHIGICLDGGLILCTTKYQPEQRFLRLQIKNGMFYIENVMPPFAGDCSLWLSLHIVPAPREDEVEFNYSVFYPSLYPGPRSVVTPALNPI